MTMPLQKLAVLGEDFNPVCMQTVSRQLAHKRRIENVYVTSMDQISENEFVCGAYVPQANSFLNDMRSDANDVTLAIIEIGRQIGIALCHTYLGVEHGDMFILDTLRLESFPVHCEINWTKQESLAGKMTMTNRIMRADGALGGVSAIIDFHCGEMLFSRLHSNWSIQPAESGKRLRELSRRRNLRNTDAIDDGAPPFAGFKVQPVFPAKRPLLQQDLWVSLNGAKFAAGLEVDQENLFFFDHENDHVPGMLIMEGMRELAMDVALRFPRKHGEHPRVLCLDAAFKHYAELDHPVTLVADLMQSDAEDLMEVCIEVHQLGKVVATGHLVVE